MKKLLLTTAILATASMAPFTAKAESVKYDFDKVHSQILFFVDHLGFTKSQGEFHDYDGYIMFDQTTPENSSVEVTIKTASIDMDDTKWDDHMKNQDFFDVAKFPDMTFKSTDIKVTGENTADITGDLTILETTKPVVLHTTFNKAGAHPYSGKETAGFSATANIKRSDFGMTYGIPAIGDDVKIMIEAEVNKASE